MSLLVVAFDPADYTGWGGSGAPSYSGISRAWGIYSYGVELSNGVQLPLGPTGFGRGCLWKSFTPQTATFYAGGCMAVRAYPAVADKTTALMVFHDTSAQQYILIRPLLNGSSTTTTMEMYRTGSLLDTTQYVLIATFDMYSFMYGQPAIWWSLDISGIGTPQGRITWCLDNIDNGRLAAGTAVIDQLVDLSAFTQIDAMSIHSTSSGNSDWSIYGTVVSEISVRASSLTVFVPTSNNGTFSEWLYASWTFSTHPTAYTAYGTGLYGTKVGNRTTYVNRSTPPTVPAGYEIRGVGVGANMRGGTENTVSVAPYVYNPTTQLYYSNNAVNCTPAGAGTTWIWDTDPITKSKWLSDNLNSYEFGMIRVT